MEKVHVIPNEFNGTYFLEATGVIAAALLAGVMRDGLSEREAYDLADSLNDELIGLTEVNPSNYAPVLYDAMGME